MRLDARSQCTAVTKEGPSRGWGRKGRKRKPMDVSGSPQEENVEANAQQATGCTALKTSNFTPLRTGEQPAWARWISAPPRAGLSVSMAEASQALPSTWAPISPNCLAPAGNTDLKGPALSLFPLRSPPNLQSQASGTSEGDTLWGVRSRTAQPVAPRTHQL